MSKKKNYEDEDLDNEDFSGELGNELDNEVDNEMEDDSISEISEDISMMSDDIDSIDLIIEISDDDSSVEEVIEPEDIVLSKHKVQGKHSLKYDSIFKGKKDEKIDEDNIDHTGMYFSEKFEVDKSSFFYVESHDN